LQTSYCYFEPMIISDLLLQWYKNNKRDLPWRNTQDPYSIWISEIILQQTRVAQGLPYYTKFINAFPTINEFSNASEDEILKLWQGLGYYSRARNMHKAAKYIVQNHQSTFPNNITDLLKIPGIGKYTANAIGSMAFDLKVVVVDGNVYRVISRLLAIDEDISKNSTYSTFYSAALQLMNNASPAEFNQAMMELGALICTPKSPNCAICPLQILCIANSKHMQTAFPVNLKKVKIKNRYFNYVVLIANNRTLVYQRTNNDIWKNLWEFPLFETPNPITNPIEIIALINENVVKNANLVFKESVNFKHVLTHQNIFATFWVFTTTKVNPLEDKYELVEIDEINIKFALSRLTDKFISSYF
jgi:A/G-specific adenine glycosylase